MKSMRHYTINKRGAVPSFITKLLSWVEGSPVNRDTFQRLDSDITFIVVDCHECHGNTTKGDKTAWLCPKNGDNSWNVSIEVK